VRCVKCGLELKTKRQRHDCAGRRQRRGLGVTADIERLKTKNTEAIQRWKAGERPVPPEPGGGQSSGPQSFIP
jgi:hypothetical protein